MIIPTEEKRLREIIKILRRLRIKYCVYGALAAWYWGEPRVTRDVDFMISVSEAQSSEFTKYSRRRGWKLFNANGKYILEFPDTHMFFEFWLPLSDFDRETLRRAQNRRVKLFSGESAIVRLAEAENVVIGKLNRWKPRDEEDVLSILNRQGKKLNRKYLWSWVVRLRTLERRFRRVVAQSVYKNWLLEKR